MSDVQPPVSSEGLVRTFIKPAFLVFLIPVLSLFFFLHAQGEFDARARKEILEQIKHDGRLSPKQRIDAAAFYTENPVSKLITNAQFAENIPRKVRFDFATFRWMIRLAVISIVAGIALFGVAGLCVWTSMRSLRAQYLSLTAGWQLLRLFGAAQTIEQGAMVVALSYWVTALWFNVFVPKLILAAALLAGFAVLAIVIAIFKRPDSTVTVEGRAIDRSTNAPLWRELDTICAKVGTAPPDQVILGIDDNFFVTEAPVTVGGVVYRGRTLFVSLTLLKQLNGSEADAVLAHEMAHFSGNDTLYSNKITPCIARYDAYLAALHGQPIALPIFHFMIFFRALYQLSLGKLSREREFRADRIAAETTSIRDVASSLVRITAFSKFRGDVQHKLFEGEQRLDAPSVAALIGQDFQLYAEGFATQTDLGSTETAHPFDSHPPMDQRFAELGFQLDKAMIAALLDAPGDGRWFRIIDDAENLERDQWMDFARQFSDAHEQSLPYRFIPESEEERAVVVGAFPEVTFEGKKGNLVLNCDSAWYTGWSGPILFREITDCSFSDSSVLKIRFQRETTCSESLPTKKFGKAAKEVIQAFEKYYARYMSAAEYQRLKQQPAGEPQPAAAT